MQFLEIITVPMLRDNYGYILHDHETGDTVVIDPSEAVPVLKVLHQNKWRLRYILNTHHHWDHIGGNEELVGQSGAKILCSKYDQHRIKNATSGLSEGSEFHIGRSPVQIIEIPGHTLGHIAFYLPGEKALFCGDTLFSLGCGRLFEGTPEQMWNSLRRLADLPQDTKVYCGHEYTQDNADFALSIDPNNNALKDYSHKINDLSAQGLPTIPSTIAQESKCNPFLRASMLLPDFSPDQAFAKVRTLKDEW